MENEQINICQLKEAEFTHFIGYHVKCLSSISVIRVRFPHSLSHVVEFVGGSCLAVRVYSRLSGFPSTTKLTLLNSNFDLDYYR